MSTRIVIEIVLIFLMIIANGVFAMSEIALVSARKVRLEELARRGSRRAASALRLAQNPDRFLSTVQIGITLIGVLAGAFGGATIAEELAVLFTPALGPRYSEYAGIGIVVVSITYLSLILGELVPKKIGMGHPERISATVAPLMGLLARVAAPAVFFLTASTNVVLKVLRLRRPAEPTVTESELKALLKLGMTAGTIQREEREIVERVFRLGERRVTAVMTPRVELEWLDLEKPLDELREQVSKSKHSWFALAHERIDDIQGIVRGRELWSQNVETTADVEAIALEPLFIPESLSAFAVLQRFRETRGHLAVVLDEFGGVEGLVTATDILEALVGELPASGDGEETMMVRLSDGSWSVDAQTDLEEVKLRLGVDFIDGQKDSYQTIAGFVVDRLGSHPAIGENFPAGDLQFEVLDTDGRRIDRILVRSRANQQESPAKV